MLQGTGVCTPSTTRLQISPYTKIPPDLTSTKNSLNPPAPQSITTSNQHHNIHPHYSQHDHPCLNQNKPDHTSHQSKPRFFLSQTTQRLHSLHIKQPFIQTLIPYIHLTYTSALFKFLLFRFTFCCTTFAGTTVPLSPTVAAHVTPNTLPSQQRLQAIPPIPFPGPSPITDRGEPRKPTQYRYHYHNTRTRKLENTQRKLNTQQPWKQKLKVAGKQCASYCLPGERYIYAVSRHQSRLSNVTPAVKEKIVTLR